MSRLVYLSPVPWSSFAQRPHKFVEWFHAETGGDVLWIDPYPTRFPLLTDFRRLGLGANIENETNQTWLSVIKPSALPIEPLPGSGLLNGLVWRSLLSVVETFAQQQNCLLVIGKPSVLSLSFLRRLKGCRSVYDAMDDFPAFYSGVSRWAMCLRERQLVRNVGCILASSTAIQHHWRGVRADVRLVHNALDAKVIQEVCDSVLTVEKKVLGYVGTISAWFDWDWTIKLAKARPNDMVRLVGPVFGSIPTDLPNNIEMLPPCNHQQALLAMQTFDVGLIPFRNSELTASVDPIKYYEYRAFGLPVISTCFGEMLFRRDEEGTFLSLGAHDITSVVEQAFLYSATVKSIQKFRAENSWESRFGNAKLFGSS